MSNLTGKTILVTGATSGIGNAIANKLKKVVEMLLEFLE